jgi:glycosyltransferase involved in cell wall biosynthesis
MKIAHIAPPWLPIPPKNYGGTEIVISNLVEEQVAQGHDVTLLAPGDARTSAKLVSFIPQSLIDGGVPWQGHLKAYYHLHKSVNYIKAHPFDIVHTHLSSSADMYIFPLMAQVTAPHVMTLHSRFPFDRVGSWTGDADSYFMEWASSVPIIAISESARNEVSHPLNFVGIVHHGLPMQQFRPTVKQPEDFFVWLGRLFPEKGAHLAIEAAKKTGVPIVLAGTVDTHVPDSVRYFEEVIKPQIDDQQVKYIGPVGMKQKVDLLSRARGFLNPIEWEEPFGMVMIEAMAVGCPVISFTRGAASEIVVHRKTGFLVRDVHEMIQFIPKIGELNRATVREHVEHNFSVRVMAQKYIRLYKKVIAAPQTASVLSVPVVSSQKTQKPLVTPAPLIVKKDAPARFPYQVSRGSKTTLEVEPTP